METIEEIALACVTYHGRTEEEILADYERRCKRLRIVPLYGQLVTALKSLKAQGKVEIVQEFNARLLRKTRRNPLGGA